jgi:hypothetical protein
MQDWMVTNPAGLATNFKMYFNNLPKEQLKVGCVFTTPMYTNIAVSILQSWKEKEKTTVSSFISKAPYSFTYILQKAMVGVGEKAGVGTKEAD